MLATSCATDLVDINSKYVYCMYLVNSPYFEFLGEQEKVRDIE